VPSGVYALDKLPSVAPLYGQYSTTLPISFAAQATTVPGTGKYALEASAAGYQSQSATLDISAGNASKDFALTK